jgi:hypothetical protein
VYSISTKPVKSGRLFMPLFIFIGLAIFISGCGEKLTPSETVQAYFDAVKARDIKAISGFIIDGDIYYKAYQDMSETDKRRSLRQLSENLYERIEITEEEIFGDSAQVTMKFIGADYGKSGVYQMKLRKVGGRWKIDLGFRR